MFDFRVGSSVQVTYNFPVEVGISHGIPDAELRNFISEPAPRHVPRHILMNLRTATTGVRVPRWVKFMLGAFFCCFFIPTIFIFPRGVVSSLAMVMGWTETARGRVTSVRKGSGQVRFGNGQWQDLYDVGVEFDTADGRRITTSCEVAGEESLPKNSDGERAAGAPVTVTYYRGNPKMVIIPGGDIISLIIRDVAALLFFLVFLFVSLMAFSPFLFWWIRKRRFRRVLSEGEPGVASIDGIEAIAFTINGQQVHNIWLRIAGRSGEYRARYRTRGPRLDYFRGLQDEERGLAVLFLPENPNRLALLGVEEG